MRVSAPNLRKPAQNLGRWRAVVGVIAALMLSGCALFTPREWVGPVDEVMFVAQPDACGLAGLSGLEGQHFTLLADHQLIGQLRVIWPGQEVMSGLVSDRLNALVTDQGLIKRLSCG